MDSRTGRIWNAAGLIFLATLIAGFGIAGDTPRIDASASSVARFWRDDAMNGIRAAYLLAWSVIPFLGFATHLLRSSWRDGTMPTRSWLVATLGAAVTATGLLAASCTMFAVAEAARHGARADALVALNALAADALVIWTGGLGIWFLGLFGLAGAAGGTGILRSLLKWSALAIGVGFYLPWNVGVVAALLAVLWIALASIAGLAGRGFSAPDTP